MKILYPKRSFVLETDDKKYIPVKEGDLIRVFAKDDKKEGVFDYIDEEIIQISLSGFAEEILIQEITKIELIKENNYEGNYLK